jgi:hypothetical protein
MKKIIQGELPFIVMLLFAGIAGAVGSRAPTGLGTEEFGMTQKVLVQSIEKVEALISKCMAEQGFQYVAADHNTVSAGMSADKKLPGLSEEQFIAQHGFGVSTMYTGLPPQLATGYSPAKLGLGERNVQIFKSLSPADQAAYNRALFGENTGAAFAVALETENFSLCGGCTQKAIQQVFNTEQLKPAYYNPKDALVNQHPRMKAALRDYAREMKKAGFDYSHPDEVEADIRARLNSLTNGGKIPVEKMTPDQRAALAKLQEYERRAALKSHKLAEKLIVPTEEKIHEEMFSRKPQ